MLKNFPPIQKTLPELFILESLDDEDEKSFFLEGWSLSGVLNLALKKPRYFYIKNEKELIHTVNLFRETQYRFLHISAHGDNKNIGLNGVTLKFSEFANYFRGHLAQRRVFLSICYSGNKEFVEELIKHNKGLQSVVAPVESISFDVSIAFWTAFYIALFNDNPNSIRHEKMVSIVKGLSILFKVKFYIGLFNSVDQSWTHLETD